ncbi:non-homologous end-joining DNA ligase [Sphaerisporangium sp. TRM90804]|uniref:non-homologous end-joining DNA ligase n=1 Tax=Sphaerisporangium sp. TRM90804 TaxID=3031113 RepID=UPI00244AE5E7|nr:non-homologous end-joining DNA ligase [Sphaerisporangium sp. TRM90804]MDH2424279.1 non-homologous end-joining DNA ligase [Sphaerisporangium sp. TRM90804]
MGALPAYTPMLAQAGPLPPPGDEDAWGHEMKWDGVRVLAYVQDSALRLISRNGKEVTAAYPELYPLAGSVGGHDVVLDGEVVAFDEAGRPSFSVLQHRMHKRRADQVQRLAQAVPVTLMLFDVLHVGTEPVVALPYAERRELLESIVTPGARWQVPVWFRDDGAQALELSRRLGIEGIVSKRLRSPYRPGRRSPDWTKVKNVRAQEVIVVGWTPGQGRRASTIGALLLGVHEGGRLVYAGNVGTGFTDETLQDLGRLLAPLARATVPVDGPVPREQTRNARWVEPVVVAEVQYAEWTVEGRLRHASWRGLRDDKEPADVIREETEPPQMAG